MRKTILALATLLFCSNLLAQAPQLMSYQAVVRNGSNQLLSNAPVGMRISVLQGSANGNAVYSETHSVTTNAQGLATLSIGGGTPQSGTFAGIDWANSPYFLKAETDPSGGSNYTITATSQLMSVPYALYAERSATPGPQGPQGPQGIQGPGASCYSCPTMVSQIYTQTFTYASNQLGVFAAREYCINLIEGGFDDWRLPELAEVEYLREVKNIDIPVSGPNGNSIYIWTKTPAGNSINNYFTSNRDAIDKSPNYSQSTGIPAYIPYKVICVR